MKGWIILGLVVSVLSKVHGETWFELKLLTFNNPSGREADGDCCDFPCSDNCDPDITVCFDKPDTGECSLAIRYTGHYHSNVFSFGNTFENGAVNPMRVKIKDPWQETLLITVNVKDRDSFNADDDMGKIRKSFTRSPAAAVENATWSSMRFIFRYQEISAQARVYCEKHYYGETCMTYCQPMNDTVNGFYACAQDGSKVCLDTYYGPDCKKKCVPVDDERAYCDINGKQLCKDGWTGPECKEDKDECFAHPQDPCYPNGNCTNYNGSYQCDCSDAFVGTNCQENKLFCDEAPCSNHSTCNNTLGGFDCLCDDGWTGKMCDIAVTPCTGRPCQNGGLCTLLGRARDAYLCHCMGPWKGINCSNMLTEVLNDTKVLFLKGYLPDDQWDDLTVGIRHLLKDLLGIIDVTIETTVTHPTEKQTRVEVFVESRDPNVVDSLDKILVLPKEEVVKSLILPLSSTQEVMKEPLAEKPDPWVKKHWYVVLLVVLIIIAGIGAVVVVLVFFNKRRQARREKLTFDTNHRQSDINGMPDAAVGFDNSLYFEVNQPDKLRGLPDIPTTKE